MDQSVSYLIPGVPTAWRRAGYGGHFYDTQKQQKLVSGVHMQKQHANRPHFQGPLELQIFFYFPLPKISKPKQAILAGQWYVHRPDLDNLCKFIMDAANSVLYHDDCLIVRTIKEKIYVLTPQDEPRTEFTISTLKRR